MIILNDLNDPNVRDDVRISPVVLFVNPATGGSWVVVGSAAVEKAKASNLDAGVVGVRISIEAESGELELGTAAILAIRSDVECPFTGDQGLEGLAPLVKTIQKWWGRGLPCPFDEMLASWPK
jgi:hypothetical protein